LLVEEGAGGGPIAFDGAGGDGEGFGGLLNGEAGEDAEFDDGGLLGVELGEGAKRIVDGFDGNALGLEGGDGFIEGGKGEAVAALGGGAGAGMIDEDAAHEGGGEGEEVGAALPIDAVVADEFEPGLVDEGGGLEGVAGSFVLKVVSGEAAEFVVGEGSEFVESGGFAGAPSEEQLGELIVRGGAHREQI